MLDQNCPVNAMTQLEKNYINIKYKNAVSTRMIIIIHYEIKGMTSRERERENLKTEAI